MRQENLLDLADAAQLASINLSKAQLLCQELCEQYFQLTDRPYPQTPEKQGFIIWEHRHYAFYAHIIQDYLLQAEVNVLQLVDTLLEYLGSAPVGGGAELALKQGRN